MTLTGVESSTVEVTTRTQVYILGAWSLHIEWEGGYWHYQGESSIQVDKVPTLSPTKNTFASYDWLLLGILCCD